MLTVAVLASPVIALGVASGATNVTTLNPGDSMTVACAGSTLSVSSSTSSQEVIACAGLPDLVVKSVSVSPANPAPGQPVTFSAVVQNIGSVATPAAFGTAFLVNGTKVSWHDASGTLAAGTTATYTANDGPTGAATWPATAGTYTIQAEANDTALFSEASMANNSLASTLTVAQVSNSLAAPSGYASSQLVFDDNFAGTTLNTSHWRTYLSDNNSNGTPWNSDGAGGSGMAAGQYDAEYFKPSAVSVNNGLSLTATRGSSQSGYGWTSGVVSTYGLESFSRGYVQVKAWMPDMTTGMWPGIWFLGAPGSAEGPEIDLNEGGYLSSANTNLAANLHSSGNTQQIINTGTDMSAGWHVYGMDYEPGQSITMYLDGKQIAKYTTNVPTGSYYLILDLQVAQNTSGWHSLVGSTTPTSTMRVAEVQAFS